jgi:hypothetical protein
MITSLFKYGNKSKKSIYVSGCVFEDPRFEIITTKSDDFLGIRDTDLSMINWLNQMEIGAALALRKKVITVGSTYNHPNLLNFPDWNSASIYVRNSFL